MAFVHALMAAAVAKSVMVDCAKGLITSCDSSARRQFKPALHIRGYDTFILHGLRFSVKFLSSRKDGNDFQGIMNKHNLRAGRLVSQICCLFLKLMNGRGKGELEAREGGREEGREGERDGGRERWRWRVGERDMRMEGERERERATANFPNISYYFK